MCSILLLKHEIAERKIKYFVRLLKNTNNIFKLNNFIYYKVNYSLLFILNLFRKNYNINIVGNSLGSEE